MTNQKAKTERKSARDLKNLCILPGNSAAGLGSRRERRWGFESIYDNTTEMLEHLPPKSYHNFI